MDQSVAPFFKRAFPNKPVVPGLYKPPPVAGLKALALLPIKKFLRAAPFPEANKKVIDLLIKDGY